MSDRRTPREASHTEILQAVNRMAGAVEAKLESVERRLEHGDRRFDEISAQVSSHADKSAVARRELSERLGALEERRRIDEQVDIAVKENADKWRGRFYAVLRYVLPPSLSASLVLYLVRLNGGDGG